MEPRREIKDLAEKMEYKLALHDDRGGWTECDLQWLLGRLREETDELEKVMKEKGNGWINKLCLEAADVANFAMMIQDAAVNQWATEQSIKKLRMEDFI